MEECSNESKQILGCMKHVANEVSSTTENMIKENNDKYFWPIFFLFSSWKLAELTGADLIIPQFTKFGSH